MIESTTVTVGLDVHASSIRLAAVRGVADNAIQAAFAGARCRGLDFASERARWVYAGVESRSMLMPGVR